VIAQILKYKNHFWLFVAMLVAFALRVYALSAQSLWNDEGTSVALAQLSLEAITNGAARDIHPPLYYYLLHFWMPLVGQSEFAVRFLSVIAGVLTIAFTFRIAYVFFNEEVAIFAAYLSAFSPFQVYYSQEARMYVWVTLFAAISVYAMMQWVNLKTQNSNPKPVFGIWDLGFGIWLIYIPATIAMLYTQYIGAFVVVVENLAFAVWLIFAIRDQQSSVLRPPSSVKHSLAFWLAAQIIIGLMFLPWYLSAGGQLASWPSISEPIDLPTLVWRGLNVFSVGTTLEPGGAILISIAFAIVFFIGWRRARAVNTNWVIVTLILWTLVPVAMMYIVSLSRPAYNPKFLLLATPPFFILVARGLSTIYPGVFLYQRRSNWRNPFRYLNLALAILVSAGPLTSLDNYYHNPKYARDDYRAVVQFIDANARAGDGILVDAPAQIDVVRYYWRGNQQLFLLPRMRPPEPNATRADVDAMLGKVTRLFAIFYATEQSDPQAIIDNRLAERAFKARDEWRGNVRLAIYGIAPNARGTPQSLNVQVGDEIVLQDYQLDQREARAGDVLTLTLNWRAERTPSMRTKVFVHLVDANGKLVAQRDGEPMSDLRITTTWRAGEIIVDNYGVFIEPGTPPGEYKIVIGMYRVDNGARLRIGAGDQLIVGKLQVVK
jgi:uncharacterized membrane protein